MTVLNYVPTQANAEPIINDTNLNVQTVFEGMNFPTSMAFLGKDDILVLEKNTGKVWRIMNGSMVPEPLLDVNVANKAERGMLGIAISRDDVENKDNQIVHVFLYYTETKSRDGEDLKGGEPIGNRLYRYDLKDDKLVNPKLILDLPAMPGYYHQGGALVIGPDQLIYLIYGDVDHLTKAQNILNGSDPDGTSGILRITQDGNTIQSKNVLGEKHPLDYYFAYGIRNGFGIDFDPVTGNLWDTENGYNCCDEINLVEPGFNSGWKKVQGIWEVNDTGEKIRKFNEQAAGEQYFTTFGKKGKYSSPEFIWDNTVGPSAILFLTSDNLGKEYKNDIFVGNVNEQNIYHFDLTKNRTELLLNGNLSDKISNSSGDLKDHVFASNIHRVTDLDVGPDGNLYILSHSWNQNQSLIKGYLYKISKSS